MDSTKTFIHKTIMLIAFAFSSIVISQNKKNNLPVNFNVKIDSLFNDWDNPKTPGAVVMVTRNDNLVFKKGYGMANLEYAIPNDPDKTVFHIASLSKQFTAFAILLLDQEKKLSIKDDIRTYLPYLPDYGYKISINNLLTHTSGLPEAINLMLLSGTRLDDIITQKRVLNLIKKQKNLNSLPSENYAYSNTGYFLLAEIIEKASGTTYGEFIKDNILDPLQMFNTVVLDSEGQIVNNRSYSYLQQEDSIYIKGITNDVSYGPHGVLTTASDFSKWATNFNTLKIGSKELIDRMNTRGILTNKSSINAASGQFVGDYGGYLNYWHSGRDAGFNSYFLRFPEQNFSVAVFANCDNTNATRLALGTVNLFWDDVFTDKPNETNIPSNAATDEINPIKTITLSNEHLKKFEGKYWDTSDFFSREIILENDTLRYTRPNGRKTNLIPIDQHKFKYDIPNLFSTISFKPINEQEFEMSLDLQGKNYMFLPFNDNIILNNYVGQYYCEALEVMYNISNVNGKLILSNIRSGSFPLETIRKDILFNNEFYIGQLKFNRSKSNNSITGFNLSNQGARTNMFIRL